MKTLYKRLRSIRGVLFGINATQARFDILQTKLGEIVASAAKVEAQVKTIDTCQSKLDEISITMKSLEDGVKGGSLLQGTLNELLTATKSLEISVNAIRAQNQNWERTSLKQNEAVKVVFVVQHPSIWPTWRSIWNAMVRDPRFIVKVVLSPFIHPFSSPAVTLDDMRQCLIRENVSFCVADFLNFDQFRPHVVFLQNPYDETRPEFLRSELLARKGLRLAYVPYGVEMGGGAWNLNAQFNLPFHRLAWRIFARSDRHKKMFAKYCRAGNSHVVVTGHPKFDSINFSQDASLPKEITKKINGRKVILWTPHFSVSDIPAWSTYRLYSECIFAEFAERQDLFLLFRPHPLFFKSMLQYGVWNASEEIKFRQTIGNSNNIGLDESSDYHAAFSASDALMTDVGSFLLEYLPTGKPLLYLHHPNGLGMNDDEELVNFLYVASSDSDIKKFIEMISSESDPRKSERELVCPEFLSGIGKDIGGNICQHIYSSIALGDTWFPQSRHDSVNGHEQDSDEYRAIFESTNLASLDSYEKEAILDEALQRFPIFENAIDISCGDGKFTMYIAKHANRVLAYDMSSAIIDKAIRTANASGVTNVTFFSQEIENIAPAQKFDLVSCLEGTSGIIDDLKFLFFLDKLKALSKNDAFLFMIDSLSTVGDRTEVGKNGYGAKYRSITDYRSLLYRAGFFLQEEILIKEDAEKNLTNKLFIMRRCD